MSSRVQKCNRGIYGFGGFFNFSYFNYEFHLDAADCLSLKPNQAVPTRIAIPLAIILSAFILQQYFAAAFLETTRFEKLFALGLNSAYLVMNAAQWFLLFKEKRSLGVCIINQLFAIQFAYIPAATPTYEICSFVIGFLGVGYPFLYIPLVYTISWYMPGLFNLYMAVIYGIVNFLMPEHGTDTELTVMASKFIVISILSVSMAHGVINMAIVWQWIFAYQYTAVQYIKILQR